MTPTPQLRYCPVGKDSSFVLPRSWTLPSMGLSRGFELGIDFTVEQNLGSA